MAGGTIGIAQETGLLRTSGVGMLCCTFLAFVLIAQNVNRLYSMMERVFATFQATVAGMMVHLRLFWAELVDILVGRNPEQALVIPDELPVNPCLREVVLYQKMFPSLEGYSSDTFLAFVLIAQNVNRLYSMMERVFATFQATVAGMMVHLRLFWAELVDILVGRNPEQALVIPDELPVNPCLREVVLYQKMFPSLEGYSSDSSDNDNQDRFEE